MLLGEIGGFAVIFLTLLRMSVGSLPEKLFDMNKAKDLFRTNLKHKAFSTSQIRTMRAHEVQALNLTWFQATKRLQFSTRSKVQSLGSWLCACLRRHRDQKLNRVIDKSTQKVAKMLDLRTLIEH